MRGAVQPTTFEPVLNLSHVNYRQTINKLSFRASTPLCAHDEYDDEIMGEIIGFCLRVRGNFSLFAEDRGNCCVVVVVVAVVAVVVAVVDIVVIDVVLVVLVIFVIFCCC